MKSGDSQQNLITNSVEDIPKLTRSGTKININDISERPLGPVEKTFLLHAERGDCATVKRIIHEYRDIPEEFDINCVDPLNRSALTAAIENENIELIKLLLEEKIQVKDGLLHAIKEEYVEGVEVLLAFEEENHEAGKPYSWEAVDRSLATFTPDITPLILAAHKNNYEIIKILLDRGATLPMPHDVKCGCDECVESSSADSLRHSQARINAYRALSASSLIALSSKDPLLTAFELSWELRRLSRMETEFRGQYNDMRTNVQNFATSLLDHARTSRELEISLNYQLDGDSTWEPGEHQNLERLKLAIKYKQKLFVAHPSVQQLLAAIWYEGLPGFRRKSAIGQLIQVAHLAAMFPVYCTIYMMAPQSKMGLFMKKPFVKFICHSTSYAYFLTLLGAASQRVEIVVLEWFGNDYIQELVAEWRRKERGAGPGIAECGVIVYIISLIWSEIRALWSDGIMEYIADLWNIVDCITNIFYVTWLALRISSFYIVWREASEGRDPWYPREQWHSFDPMLLSEGAFAAGMIFSFLKLVHIFSVNPHLGPLQISLGRMIIDIVKFFFIYTLVLFAFGCGLNQLLWYYAELEKSKCYHLPSGLPDFDNQDKACSIWRRYANLFETSQSLFWASFGLVDLVSFELTGIKGFTRFWALLMFGSYSVINVIVLLNMLIAMMSNSYQIISERSDSEWKFARTKLWISYFDDGDTLPPPFNIFPRPKNFLTLLGCIKTQRSTQSFKRKTRENDRARHENIMRLLVKRYVTAEQSKRDDFGISEDDVMEIRQDISTFRYELIDILKKNGMKTPTISNEDNQLSGKKGKVMERRLLKDFHIGIVEAAVSEAVVTCKEPKDIFGHLAKVIGKRGSSKRGKDWNALVRKNTVTNPIGTAKEAENSRIYRQSLRRHILTNIKKPVEIDQDKLIEYNPKLSEVPKGARVAYAKFMTKKIQQDYSDGEIEPEENATTTAKAQGAKPSVKFKGSIDDRNVTDESKKSDLERKSTESKITGSGDTLKSVIRKPEDKMKSPKVEDQNKTDKPNTEPPKQDDKEKSVKSKEESNKADENKTNKPEDSIKGKSEEAPKRKSSKSYGAPKPGEASKVKEEEQSTGIKLEVTSPSPLPSDAAPKLDVIEEAGPSKAETLTVPEKSDDTSSEKKADEKPVIKESLSPSRVSVPGKSKLSGTVRTGWI